MNISCCIRQTAFLVLSPFAECLRCRFCERIEWILIERALVIAHSDLNSQLTASQMDLQRPCDRRLSRPRSPCVNVLVICFPELNKRTMPNFRENGSNKKHALLVCHFTFQLFALRRGVFALVCSNIRVLSNIFPFAMIFCETDQNKPYTYMILLQRVQTHNSSAR